MDANNYQGFFLSNLASRGVDQDDANNHNLHNQPLGVPMVDSSQAAVVPEFQPVSQGNPVLPQSLDLTLIGAGLPHLPNQHLQSRHIQSLQTNPLPCQPMFANIEELSSLEIPVNNSSFPEANTDIFDGLSADIYAILQSGQSETQAFSLDDGKRIPTVHTGSQAIPMVDCQSSNRVESCNYSSLQSDICLHSAVPSASNSQSSSFWQATDLFVDIPSTSFLQPGELGQLINTNASRGSHSFSEGINPLLSNLLHAGTQSHGAGIANAGGNLQTLGSTPIIPAFSEEAESTYSYSPFTMTIADFASGSSRCTTFSTPLPWESGKKKALCVKRGRPIGVKNGKGKITKKRQSAESLKEKVTFTNEIQEDLKREFLLIADNPFLTSELRGKLQKKHGLSKDQLNNWFSLHRHRYMECSVDGNGNKIRAFKKELNFVLAAERMAA